MLIRHAFKICKLARNYGGDYCWEWSERCDLWKDERVAELMKSRGGLSWDDSHSAISDHARRIVEQTELRQRLRKLTVSHKIAGPSPDGFELADIDAALELWFDGPGEVAGFFGSPAYLEHVAPREEEAFDVFSVRALVARLQVIHDEFSFQPTTMQPFGFRWRP